MRIFSAMDSLAWAVHLPRRNITMPFSTFIPISTSASIHMLFTRKSRPPRASSQPCSGPGRLIGRVLPMTESITSLSSSGLMKATATATTTVSMAPMYLRRVPCMNSMQSLSRLECILPPCPHLAGGRARGPVAHRAMRQHKKAAERCAQRPKAQLAPMIAIRQRRHMHRNGQSYCA